MRSVREIIKRVASWINWRGVLLLAFLAIAFSFILPRLNFVYPVSDWLVWPLAKIWGSVLFLNLACLCMGLAFVRRALGLKNLEAKASLLFGISAGVVIYTLSMYLLGWLGGYRPLVLFSMGGAFVLVGAKDLWTVFQQLRSHSANVGAIEWITTAFGVFCVVLVYLQLMTPDALNYDSVWCHLPIAQDYAREGRMVPFYADYSKNVPQLASILHVWGFLLPGLDKPVMWMHALHLEFVLFLWTLFGIVVGTEWATERTGLRSAWVAFFLFPAIFVYDSNMGGAADHVLAFFAVPMLLAAAQLLKAPTHRWAVLFGLLAGGASLTKYQSIYSLIPLLAILGLRYVYLAFVLLRDSKRRGSKKEWLRLSLPLVTLGSVTLLVVAPHFLKNQIFYSNPFYPLAQEIFTKGHPTVERGSLYINNVFKAVGLTPQGTPLEKLWSSLQLFVSFSIDPPYAPKTRFPSFGFLFTLLLPTVVLVPQRKRVLFVLATGSGALLVWGYVFFVERNIQTFLPIMVVGTAALIIKLWPLGRLVQVGVVSAVLFQVIWNGDAFFYSGDSRLASSVAMIRSGYDGKAKTRFAHFQSNKIALGEALPEDARLLLHTAHANLGIDRELYLDWAGYQGRVDYTKVTTARELFDYYTSLGITHVAYRPWRDWANTKQEELVFAEFVRQVGPGKSIHDYRLIELSSELRPSFEESYKVVLIDVRRYQSGLYDVAQLVIHETIRAEVVQHAAPREALPPGASTLPPSFRDADIVVIGEHTQQKALQRSIQSRYTLAGRYNGWFSVYLQRASPQKKSAPRGGPAPTPAPSPRH